MVSDILVQKLSPVSGVQTCGRVIVKRRGRVIAKKVTAQLGVEVLGVMNADVVSTGPVVIGLVVLLVVAVAIGFVTKRWR